MANRAAICIGVNRPTGMPALAGCSDDARAFQAWAQAQGLETTLLVDTDAAGQPLAAVGINEVFDAIKGPLKRGSFAQLLVYFSGHGILLAPGAEYWLLSRGPENPNEAINLMRSVEDARNTGIPHIAFISDACRSAAVTAEQRGVTGGVIFPALARPPKRSEIDVYYATLPGDQAQEVSTEKAVEGRSQAGRGGLFTSCLLKVLNEPPPQLVDSTLEGADLIHVLASRRLKDHLETVVPDAAAAIHIKLNQSPEVHVESALPKYLARVAAPAAVPGRLGAPAVPAAARPTRQRVMEALANAPPEGGRAVMAGAAAQPPALMLAAKEMGLIDEVEDLAGLHGRDDFASGTGFSIVGAQKISVLAPAWQADAPFAEPVRARGGALPALHVGLQRAVVAATAPSSLLIEFTTAAGAFGAVLPVLPDFVGTLVVDGARVKSINYVPSAQAWRHAAYQRRAKAIERMKAVAAVASRQGRFIVEDADPARFADRARLDKGLDPMLGVYAAYAYAQSGRYDDALSVFGYMIESEAMLPVPFDVAMLALRADPAALQRPDWRVAPFVPLLSQGWTLLGVGDAMHRDIHQRLRPHLLPALFTTLDAEGTAIARQALIDKEVA